MLDRKFIVENAEAVAKNCELRGVTADVARLVELEGQRRELLQQTEELNRRANEVSKSIGQASSDEERRMKPKAVPARAEEVLRSSMTKSLMRLKISSPAFPT